MNLLLYYKALPQACRVSTKMLLVMKCTAFIMLAFCLNLHARGVGQQLTFSVTNKALTQVFREIEKQSGFQVFYKDNLLKADQRVSVQLKNASLTEALTAVLKDQPLDYSIINRTIVIKEKKQIQDYLRALFIPPATRIGIVRDGMSGKGMAGVSVMIKGSNKTVVTNTSGAFSINADDDDILLFSYIGYTKKEARAGAWPKGTMIMITLDQEQSELDQMVVIGYGSVKRKDLTGSVASVNPDELKNIPFMTFDAALAGKAPGVQVTKADGSPGGAVRIRIRGGSSLIGANDPLYVIDGVPVLVENKYVGVTDLTNPIENYGGEQSRNSSISGSFSRGLNNLGGLNIDDIESIDILKDASATAIYGSKAANGVVIINTKKGKLNQKPTLELNYYTGMSKMLREKVLDASQYKMILTEAATNRVNGDIALGRTPDAVAKAIVSNPGLLGDGSVNTDWLGLVSRTGITQNANISVRGGGTGSRYYTSLSYAKQNGVLIGTDFSKIAGKINLDNEINSKLRVITNIDYGFSTTNITNGIYAHALQAPPIFTPYNADGSFANFDAKFAGLTPAGGGIDFGVQNPLALATALNRGNNITALGSLTLEYDIIKGLRYRSTASVNYSNYRQRDYTPSYLEIANDNSQGGQSSNGGVGSQSNSSTINSFFENTVTWDKQFNANNRITLLGGTSWEKYTTEFFSAEGRGYPNDAFLNNLSSAATATSVKGSNPSGEYALLSFYARANYALKEKYLFTFTGRNDISSKFARGKQSAYFPSGAIAWRISDEKFLKQAHWINDLKLRVSAGYTGSQSIGNNLFLTLYAPAAYAGSSAFIPSQLGNDDIKWERTLQKDVGLDFALLNNRIKGSFGYYEKNTNGLLLNMTTPPSYGYGSVIMNIANVSNHGFELELRGDLIRKKDFQWNLAFNIARNRSLVTEIKGGPFSDPNNRNALNLGTSIVREGDPLGLIYGRVATGLFKTQKEVDDYKKAVYYATLFNRYIGIGDTKFDTVLSSVSGGTRYVNYKQDVIGNMNPSFYGGFTNTFTYKNFNLMALFSYSYGNDLLFQGDVRDKYTYNTANKGVRILDRWTPDNTETNRPRLIYGISDFTNNFSVYKGSFLKLKSLTIGYELPKKAVTLLHLRMANFYLSATNIFTITGYPGLDPEVTDDPRSIIGGGRDLGMYPTTREFTAGLRVGL
jgi:TonB-linked SusC/RagA family outer membrane protein